MRPLSKAARLGTIAAGNDEAFKFHELSLDGKPCRVFVISDVHTDAPANLDWLHSRCRRAVATAGPGGVVDVCVCAGDISDNLSDSSRRFAPLQSYNW